MPVIVNYWLYLFYNQINSCFFNSIYAAQKMENPEAEINIEQNLADQEVAQSYSAYLSNAAMELIQFKTPREVFVYTVNKLYQLFNRRVIITGVEYDNPNNRWKMHEVKGVNTFMDNALKSVGLNLREMEGEIDTRYLSDVKKGQFVELDFNLNTLTNGKYPAKLNNAIKKIIPVKKVLVIPIKKEETIFGTITLIITRKSTDIVKNLSETFIAQISVFVEKLLTESELRANEKRLNAVERIARIGNYEIDLNSNNAIWSEETYLIYGLEYQKGKEIPSSEYEGFVHPEDRASYNDHFEQCLSELKNFNLVYRIITTDEEVRYVHCIGEFEINDKGRPVKLFGTLQDISIQKKFEAELLEAKMKAEQADRLKSAFLANMSHEIRTPMNGILGFSDLLQRSDLTSEKMKLYVGIIQKSGERMLRTINDIIEISKIETGQVEVSTSDVNVSEHIKFIHDFFNHEAEKKGMNIAIYNALSEEESNILTDDSKFDSILTNLVKNAIKYSEEGTILISCFKVGEQLMFSVKDMGLGIPEDRQDAIFERFVQADIEDRDAHEGAGLGLAIVKAYVEMLGGNIWVESEVGKGSNFQFTIDYNPASSTGKVVEKDTKIIAKSHKEVTVLIAEDDADSIALLENVLSAEYFNLMIVKNGKDAILQCKKHPELDLILMDIKMPKVNGIEAVKKIRKFNKTVPIVAQSAFAFVGDKEKALNAGCNDYITKPIKTENFIRTINKYI